MKLKYFLLIAILILSIRCKNQQKVNSDLLASSDFFESENPKVLVVGSFHFDYPNLDAVKTDSIDQIDILSNQKQIELAELLDYLKLFRPTKIGVESYGNPNFTQELKKYQNGEIQLSRDERHQIGVKLADELKLDTIYSLDAISFYEEIKEVIPNITDSLMIDFDFSNTETDLVYNDWNEYSKSLQKEISLLKYFKYINTEEYHGYQNGYYYLGDFKNAKYSGADMTTIYWFSRNLRILRRIQDIIENKEDRILVIFGNSHAAALRRFLSDSPDIDFVEFGNLKENTIANTR